MPASMHTSGKKGTSQLYKGASAASINMEFNKGQSAHKHHHEVSPLEIKSTGLKKMMTEECGSARIPLDAQERMKKEINTPAMLELY
mmetsp:Transcript_16615/g.14458  ORF Transcript_16615/g.14458 Transcript_16615/m.14458 type:complete len:87 (-) Transcript_16615:245-505(-)